MWMLLNEFGYAFASITVPLSVVKERIVAEICGLRKERDIYPNANLKEGTGLSPQASLYSFLQIWTTNHKKSL